MTLRTIFAETKRLKNRPMYETQWMRVRCFLAAKLFDFSLNDPSSTQCGYVEREKKGHNNSEKWDFRNDGGDCYHVHVGIHSTPEFIVPRKNFFTSPRARARIRWEAPFRCFDHCKGRKRQLARCSGHNNIRKMDFLMISRQKSSFIRLRELCDDKKRGGEK